MNVKYEIIVKGNNPAEGYKKNLARKMAGALVPFFGCSVESCTVEGNTVTLTYSDYSEYAPDGEVFSILVKFED